MITVLLDKEIEIKIYSNNRKQYESILCKSLKNGDVISINQYDILPASRAFVECQCDNQNCKEIFTRKRVDVKDRTYCSTDCRNAFLLANNPNPPKKKVSIPCSVCGKKVLLHLSEYLLHDEHRCSIECYIKSRSRDKSETKPERMVREWLESNKIKYTTQKTVVGRYVSDFYIEEFSLILEVYGDFWHVNPETYDIDGTDSSKKPLSDLQVKILSAGRDPIRKKRVISEGYNFEVIWEKEVHEDINKNMSKIMSKYKDLSDNPGSSQVRFIRND